jgi:hypothetical protein
MARATIMKNNWFLTEDQARKLVWGLLAFVIWRLIGS